MSLKPKPPSILDFKIVSHDISDIPCTPAFGSHQKRVRADWILLHSDWGSLKHCIVWLGMAANTALMRVFLQVNYSRHLTCWEAKTSTQMTLRITSTARKGIKNMINDFLFKEIGKTTRRVHGHVRCIRSWYVTLLANPIKDGGKTCSSGIACIHTPQCY